MEEQQKINSQDFLKKKFDKVFIFPKIILFFVLAFLFLIIFIFFILNAPSDFPKGNVFTVENGESLRSLSKNLKEQKFIRSRVAFESFTILYGGEKHIATGDYLFEEKYPVFEIARRIASKDRHLSPLKITIPEGYDNIEIAELFSSKLKSFNKDKFINDVKNKEGYLFPDTYFFFTTDNENDVEKYLTDNFNRKIKDLLPEINNSGKAEKDIIIMASIIEREAKGDNDRAVISGILWNRINKGMPLQVDADPTTYKKKGLPMSPICNPGILAIKAALHPVTSSYLYYLHDENGSIHYAKSFTEHKQNIKKYLK